MLMSDVSSNFNGQATNVDEFFWKWNLLLLSMGTIFITVAVTFFAVIIWRSREQRKVLSSSSSSITVPTSNEMKLFPIIPKFVQPNPPPLTLPLINGELTTSTDNHSSSSSTGVGASKKFRKNLLERRGSNNSLTISISPKHRLIQSPPAGDCPSDEYLRTATRKLTIEQLHEHAQDTRSLYQEFWTVPTNHLEKLRICGAGTKNRYGTIIANEHSRVKLTELPGDPLSSYINANYVHGWPNDPRAFIATQGPLANTIVDFYRMIWQENVSILVMITRFFEKNKAKCERYLPDSQSSHFGPFFVQVVSVSYHTDYEVRHLTIEYENEQREIQHFWYTAWPDQSCPDISQPLIEMIENVEKCRSFTSGPVLVHCSAGIGRTGCFIGLSNGMKQLNEERNVDVVRILCDLRRDRGGMIQTNDQYQFVYQALSEYARSLKATSTFFPSSTDG